MIKIINTCYLIVSIGQELGRSLRSRWRLELELKDTLLTLQSSPPHTGGTRGWLTVTVSQLLRRVQLFAISWTAAHQAPLSSPISRSSLKLMSTKSVIPSNHLILCHPLLLPSVFPSTRVFSNESVLRFKWPKCWSFSISPFNEYSGLISFRIDWFDVLAVQGTLKSLL